MGHHTRRSAVGLALALAAAAAAAACGDPVVVIGDQPGIMRIVAGVPDPPDGAQPDTLATATPLVTPRGVAIGDDGVLYIGARRRIVSVTSTARLTVLADGGLCSGAECLMRVEAVALTGDGRLIIADAGGDRLFALDLATRALHAIAGTGVTGFTPDGEPAATAAIGVPTGVVVGAGGRIIFSERSNQRIRSIEPDGTLATIAGMGLTGADGDGGPATDARFAGPAGLALAAGVLYIADAGNHRVRAVDLATGLIRGVAGVGDPAFDGDDGPAADAHLFLPTAVAVSPDQRTLFIADSRNNRIRAVDLARGTITTFAGTGDIEFTGNLEPAGETSLDSPVGLAASARGLLFIADTGHGLVWRTPVR